MTNQPLSPAAAAVLDAFYIKVPMPGTQRLAAALRAAADQVVPFPGRYPMNEYMEGLRAAKQNVRQELRIIAAELEAQ